MQPQQIVAGAAYVDDVMITYDEDAHAVSLTEAGVRRGFGLVDPAKYEFLKLADTVRRATAAGVKSKKNDATNGRNQVVVVSDHASKSPLPKTLYLSSRETNTRAL